MKLKTKKRILRILTSFIGILSALLMLLGIFAVPIFVHWIRIVDQLHILHSIAIKMLLLFLAGFSGIIIPLTSILMYSIYEEMIKRLEVEPEYLKKLDEKLFNE